MNQIFRRQVSRFTLPLLAAGIALGTTASTATAEDLRITYASPNAVYWDIDVAIDKGFFKAEGFEPKKIALQSSVGSVQQVISDSTNFAATSPEPVIAAYERGAKDIAIMLAPVKAVAWSFVGGPGVKSFADIKGKKIGVSAMRGGESTLINVLLQKNGLSQKDYAFIQIGITPFKYAALRKGSIAAAVLFQPTGLLAISKGMNNLANFSELTTYPYPIYAFSRKWVMQKDRGARIARAIIKAQAFIHTPATRGEAVAILAKYTKKTPAIANATADLFLEKAKIYNNGGRPDMAGLRRLVAMMVKAKLIKQPQGSVEKYVLPLEKVGYTK